MRRADFGGGANTTNTHFDAYENLMLCVDGTKTLLLYPPSETDYLYICRLGGGDHAYSAIPPMVKPSDGYERAAFPKFERAKCLEVTVHAGECLYLPIFRWHGVSGAGRNIILNWWFDMRRDKRDLSASSARPKRRPTI